MTSDSTPAVTEAREGRRAVPARTVTVNVMLAPVARLGVVHTTASL